MPCILSPDTPELTHPHTLRFIIKWACIYPAFNIYGLLKVLVCPLNPKRYEKFPLFRKLISHFQAVDTFLFSFFAQVLGSINPQ